MADHTKVLEIYKNHESDIRSQQDIISLLNRVIPDAFLEDTLLEDSIARIVIVWEKLERMWR